MRLAIRLRGAVNRPDVKRGVRPGRLGQILDDAGDAVVALDQQDVAGLDNVVQVTWVARRERLIAGHFLLKIGSDPLADSVEHYAHSSPQTDSFGHDGLFHPLFLDPYLGRKPL